MKPYSDCRPTDENTPSIAFYLRANKVSEGSLRLVMISMQSVGIFSSLFFATAGAAYYYIHDGYIEPIKLYLPLKLRYVYATYIGTNNRRI